MTSMPSPCREGVSLNRIFVLPCSYASSPLRFSLMSFSVASTSSAATTWGGSVREGSGENLVEAELGRTADNADHLFGVLHARDLDHDLVLRLHPDVGFGHAEAVYALPDKIGRLLHLLAGHLASACLGALQLRADAALEVEAELGGPRHRLINKDEVGGYPEEDDHKGHYDQVVSTTTHKIGELF